MKFAMNGAITIGTLDGANIEIRDQVGHNNFFQFGLTAAEVLELRNNGYRPRTYYEAEPQLQEALDQISSGFFSPDRPDLFKPLVDALLSHDYFMLLADWRSYVDSQERVSQAYQNPEYWTRLSILNVARIGYFSSDRAISEYCERVWHIRPVEVR